MSTTYLYLPETDIDLLDAAYNVADSNENLGAPRMVLDGETRYAVYGTTRATAAEVAAMQAAVPSLQASTLYPTHLTEIGFNLEETHNTGEKQNDGKN